MSSLIRWVDLGVVGAYLLAITSLGLGFAREQNTTERYFLARRTIPAWAIAMSLLATLTTTTAFLAYPAASFATAWALLPAAILLLPAAAIIVPFYRRAVRMSAYEYFGQRFGRGVQTYAGAAYLLGHAAMKAFLLYLLARTVHTQTGWGTDRIILVAGFLNVLYTLLGGLEAVIWTNILQGYVLLACALTALAAPRPARLIGWPSALTILYGLIWCLQKYAADQSIVQRFLAASSDRAVVKGVRIGALLCVALPALLLLPIPTTRFFRPLAHFPPGVPGLAMSARRRVRGGSAGTSACQQPRALDVAQPDRGRYRRPRRHLRPRLPHPAHQPTRRLGRHRRQHRLHHLGDPRRTSRVSSGPTPPAARSPA